MTRRYAAAVMLMLVLAGCADAITGTATWPGVRLERVLLTAADFPPGVAYDRIVEQSGQPDGVGGPSVPDVAGPAAPAMITTPEGCSDGLTRVIAATAERGPGSAAKYSVAYDGARIVMTVLTSPLAMDRLAATAQRCESFEAFFDRASDGMPVTTAKLPAHRPGALAYQQTMEFNGRRSSVFFSFENIGSIAVFGIAFPTPDPVIPVKAVLPQTFLETAAKQADRAQRG